MSSSFGLMQKNVCAIVVTYFPMLERFERALEQVCKQCDVIVVDNTVGSISSEVKKYSKVRGFHLIENGHNRGIATAQNQGIRFALSCGYDYFLLLDQDSILCDDFVEILMGYAASDKRTITSGRAINKFNRDVSNTKVLGSECVEQRELMSSGTLLHRDIIVSVGLFDETLFIDCVDFEWGWRARSLGWRLQIVRNAKFSHTIGDGEVRYRQMPSPIRHYYQTRNICEMLTRPYVPIGWKLTQLFLFVPKMFKIILFGSQKQKRLKYFFRGIFDFFRGHFGPLA